MNVVPRGLTSCVDAYLTPLIKEYLQVPHSYRLRDCAYFLLSSVCDIFFLLGI